ncbi:hypothetical protein KIN20_019703, partial [Parelaphostrongylus tenuis]
MICLIGGIRFSKCVLWMRRYSQSTLQSPEKTSPQEESREIRTSKTIGCSHSPASVMVQAGICVTKKMPFVFINGNVKMNAAIYQLE